MIYALDFDGVICDSAYECMVTSRAAYPQFLASLGESMPADLPDDEEIAEHFCRLRYLSRTGGEFWILLDQLYKGVRDLDTEQFEAIAEANTEKSLAFEKIFFATRTAHMERDYQGWLGLNRLYPEFQSFWQTLGSLEQVVIVTSKNRAPTRALMDHFQLGIPDKDLFAREDGLHKADKIQAAARSRGVAAEQLLFVDDHLGNLHNVLPTGAPCFLALWGYCPPRLETLPQGMRGLEHLNQLLDEEWL